MPHQHEEGCPRCKIEKQRYRSAGYYKREQNYQKEERNLPICLDLRGILYNQQLFCVENIGKIGITESSGVGFDVGTRIELLYRLYF